MKLFLFPLSLELTSFVEALESHGYRSTKSVVHEVPVFEFADLKIRCALGGHGKVQFSVHTQFFLNFFKDSSSVFCMGSSGSLGRAKPLDVVVATETVEHDFNLKFINKKKPKFAGDKLLIGFFKKVKPNGFDIHFGPVASGDEDVLDRARALEIHEATGALAVAWEGAGGARVCKFLKIPFLEMRAVSDLADESTPEDFKKFVSKSMANLAALVIQAF